MTNAITPTSWFCYRYFPSQIETDSNLSSRLETVFLLESGAFVSLQNVPICMMINRLFKVCNHIQHDTSKTIILQTKLKFQKKI